MGEIRKSKVILRILFSVALFCSLSLFAYSPKKESKRFSFPPSPIKIPALALTPPSSLELCHFYLTQQKTAFSLLQTTPLKQEKRALSVALRIEFKTVPIALYNFTSPPLFTFHLMKREEHSLKTTSYKLPTIALPIPQTTLAEAPSITPLQSFHHLVYTPKRFSFSHNFSLAYSSVTTFLTNKLFSFTPFQFPVYITKHHLAALPNLLCKPILPYAAITFPKLDLTEKKESYAFVLHQFPQVKLFTPDSIAFAIHYPIVALSSFPELESVTHESYQSYFTRLLSSPCPLPLQEIKSRKQKKKEYPKEEKKRPLEIAQLRTSHLPLQITAIETKKERKVSLLESSYELSPPSPLLCTTIMLPGPQFEETNSLSIPIASFPFSSSFTFTNHVANKITSFSSVENLFLYPTRKYPNCTLPYLALAPNTILPCRDSPLAFFSDRRTLDSSLYLLAEAQQLNRTHRFIQTNLIRMPNLEDLETDSMSDEFTISVEVLPQMDHQGFLFAVTLSAENAQELDFAPHHIYFILDPSGSPDHFETFKKALLHSIAHLGDSVTYNVLLLNNDLPYLAEHDLYAGKSSFNFVKRHLSKIKQNANISFATLEQAIAKISKKAAASKEVYTAILLSSGQFMKNLRSHRESLQNMIENTPHNLSLYTTAITDKSNLPMLELLARLGKGEMIYTSTHTAFPRKFTSSIKKLLQPIAYNLHLTKVSSSPEIVLHHDNRFSPMLYAGKTYTFYGSTPKLEDLTFILQGENYGKWFHCTKKISLKNGIKGRSYLEEELATQKALLHISDFISSSNSTSLFEAKKLLAQSSP